MDCYPDYNRKPKKSDLWIAVALAGAAGLAYYFSDSAETIECDPEDTRIVSKLGVSIPTCYI